MLSCWYIDEYTSCLFHFVAIVWEVALYSINPHVSLNKKNKQKYQKKML